MSRHLKTVGVLATITAILAFTVLCPMLDPLTSANGVTTVNKYNARIHKDHVKVYPPIRISL